MGNGYHLQGEFCLSEDSRSEFEDLSIKLLNRSGARKIKKINIAGKEISVSSLVSINDKGTAYFDYSVFEKIKRSDCWINFETGKLECEQCGYGLLGNSVLLLQVLMESFSDTPVFTQKTNEKELLNLYVPANIIFDLTDHKPVFRHREDFLGVYFFLRDGLGIDKESIEMRQILNYVPVNFAREEMWTRFLDFFNLVNLQKNESVTVKNDTYTRNMILEKALVQVEEYLFFIMHRLFKKEKEVLKDFIENLVFLPLDERKKLAAEKSDYGIIAEMSLYLTADTVMFSFCQLFQENFLERVQKERTGYYTDFIIRELDKETKKETINFHFYHALEEKNEDMLLGIMTHRELQLSEEIMKMIQDWKEAMEKMEADDDFHMEEELIYVIQCLKSGWHIPYVEETFVCDFVTYQKEDAYIKAIRFLREKAEKDIRLFPEIPEEMALSWLKNMRTAKEKKEITVLLQVLSDSEARKELLNI